MGAISKIRYKVNYNPIIYNPRTKQYESRLATYLSYEQAKAKQWKCEKCNNLFATFKELRHHKIENHSY